MPPFAVISRERHADKKWRRSDGYAFAAGEAVATIVGAELMRAAPRMPLAFIEQLGHYHLVAVLSLKPGQNLFVAPDGRWLGGYVPAIFRAFPFRLLHKEEPDEAVLCIDEAKGLVDQSHSSGESFFDSDGNVSAALKAIVDFMTQIERSRKPTDLAVAELVKANVLCPWDITTNVEQSEQILTGLYRIDEAALNKVSDDVFLRLRATSALPVAYAQMASVGQFGILEHLAGIQAQLALPSGASLPKSLDHFYGLENDDLIHLE